MFTTEQLKQLSNFLIHEFREVFATKEDIKELSDKIDALQLTMDSVIKLAQSTKLKNNLLRL